MRWDSTSDQLLLIKIIETHSISVDTKKIAAAWPSTEAEPGPTPRAITERLVRIRQIVRKATGSDVQFSIGGRTSSPTSTPGKSKSVSSTPGSTKRKRGSASKKEISPLKKESGSDSDMADIEIDTPTVKKPSPQRSPLVGSSIQRTLFPKTSASEQRPVGVPVAAAAAADDDGKMRVALPSKRVRKTSVLPPGMVKYDFDDPEVLEIDTSASEYAPEAESAGAESAEAEGFDDDELMQLA
ncbi:hypothetical protein BO70DRAFT_427885 [Aspergillus heteromorphus CBS 117.55]|uniref:Uncharacterized protein n=1 Tax=Aspergillus heteromorphus CBS 117.55 TaxID=1448321 RepID=A0A317WRT8_9EURO|nr:uncharacterized protein BO70DRAFT_427885 [Aspergillus heteromorphus CBS 117.55]PWY86890.1 hypothetical protein BO70DRAFT_427885 [Aspergillus heteromorphus CBS 117.55]